MSDPLAGLPEAPGIQNVRQSGVRVTFQIPEQVRSGADPKSVTLRHITIDEEGDAIRVAEANKTLVAYELVKRALIAVDGNPVTWDRSEPDTWVAKLSPKVRNLLLKGFDSMHAPAADDAAAFLASAKTDV